MAIFMVVALLVPSGSAQAPPPPPAGTPPPPPPGASDAAPAPFKPEELEQIVAPIALYPDPLLAQIFMASTYPIEIVQAARFLKANANLKGDALNEALKKETWDDSVKSLVSFPPVLTMMDEKLDWTQKLGDAFLDQQKETMDAVQRLRAKAQAQGNLKSTAEQKVIVEPAPPAASAPPPADAQQTIIKIEPANPQVVYVPTYSTAVYGPWPYPAYPPYYYYPPGYAAGAALFSFGIGMAVGGALWGGCNWGGGEVDIDINKNNNFSRNVNRTDVSAKRTERQASRGEGRQSGSGKWEHNPEHRKGAQYRDSKTQQRFDKSGPANAASREAFRGRADQGRQDLSRGGAQGGRDFGGPSAGTREGGAGGRDLGGGGAGTREGGAGGRDVGGGGAGGSRDVGGGGAGGRDVSRGGGGSAFDGTGQGRSVQNHSQRGNSSLGSSRSSGGGASRAGGGGSRGGGGGRGGRR
jgi:hypothetical protein